MKDENIISDKKILSETTLKIADEYYDASKLLSDKFNLFNVIIVNLAFACELYLKAILLYEKQEVGKKHNLYSLFAQINKSKTKKYIESSVLFFYRNHDDFEGVLKNIGDCFVYARYTNERKQSTVDIEGLRGIAFAVRKVAHKLICPDDIEKYSLMEFINFLPYCWSKETCYPKVSDNWSKKNPFLGQCAITSVVLQECFGGEIRKIKVNNTSHYYNFIDNQKVDITVFQFGNTNINYNDYKIVTKEEILLNSNTKKRYDLLCEKIDKIIS